MWSQISVPIGLFSCLGAGDRSTFVVIVCAVCVSGACIYAYVVYVYLYVTGPTNAQLHHPNHPPRGLIYVSSSHPKHENSVISPLFGMLGTYLARRCYTLTKRLN